MIGWKVEAHTLASDDGLEVSMRLGNACNESSICLPSCVDIGWYKRSLEKPLMEGEQLERSMKRDRYVLFFLYIFYQ